MLRCLYVFCLCVSAAAAPLLQFQPTHSSPAPGGTVMVDVVLSGLPPGEPPSVGSFDLDVTYDPSIVLPVSLLFGPWLGQEALGEVIQFAFDLGGVIDFGAVSLLTGPELDALQPGEFMLAQIGFLGLQPGNSPLSFEQILIDDSDGLKLPVEGTGGGITVIPEPGTFLLTTLALVALFSWRGQRRPHRPKM